MERGEKAVLPPELEALAVDALAHLLAGGSVARLRGMPPGLLEQVYALAHGLYTQGRDEDALKAFAFLTYHDHRRYAFHLGMASCLQRLGRLRDAIRFYASAALIELGLARPQLHIAECLLGLGEVAEARAVLDLAGRQAGEDEADVRERALALLAVVDARGEESS